MALKMRKLKGINPYFVIVAALTLICLFSWRLVTDIYADDLFYMHKFIPHSIWVARGPLVGTLSDAYQSAIVHFNEFNSRLANIICIFSMLLPRAVVNVIDATIGSAFFFMLFKSGNVRFKTASINTLVVGTALFWMAFPWNEYMSSTDYFMNYAWSSAFVLIVVHFLCKSHEHSKLQLGAVSFFAVFAAWMHEAFGCALIAYTFFVWLLGPKIDKRSRLIIGLGLCVGLILNFIGATDSRIGERVSIFSLFCLQYRISAHLSQAWPTYIAIIMTIVLRRNIGKQQFKDYRVETIACFAAIAVSYLICFTSDRQGRALWPAHLFAVLQTIRCVNALTYKQKGCSKTAQIVFGCAAVLYALWSCELIRWQKKFTEESNGLIAAAQQAEEPLVYYDLTDESVVPFYLMEIVNHRWKGAYNLFLAYHTKCRYIVLILPTKYEGVPLEQLKEPGSQRICGVYPTFYTINDTTEYRFDAMLGEPLRAVNPLNRLLMKFTAEQVPEPFSKAGLTPIVVDGKIISAYHPAEVGRTVKYRKFVRIEE
jgi:hypothetical protein